LIFGRNSEDTGLQISEASANNVESTKDFFEVVEEEPGQYLSFGTD